MKRIILIVFLIKVPLSQAQTNFVPDSSFELQNGNIYDACKGIYNDSFTKYLKFWNRPTDGTPDLYSYNYVYDGILKPPFFDTLKANTCQNGVNVPVYGYQFRDYYILPKTGSNFAGFWFVEVHTSGLNYPYYREYIQTELTTPLSLNAKYRIGFSYISHPFASQYRNIDFLFTDNKIQNKNVSDCYTFPYCTGFKDKQSPQISFSEFDSFSFDTGIWNRKEIIYKNKGIGNKWLTIGSFTDTLYGIEIFHHEGSYIYLDDIFIYEIPGIISPDTVCFGDLVKMSCTLKGPVTWVNNNKVVSTDSQYNFYAKQSGWYYAISPFGKDSLFLLVNNSAFFNLGKDTFLCTGDSIVKIISINNSKIKWNDNSTNSSYSIQKGGTYIAYASKSGCTFSDTLFIDERPKPNLTIISHSEFCSPDSIFIKIELDRQYRYYWQSSRDSGAMKKLSSKGDYLISIISDNGCFSNKNIHIDDICTPTIWVPNGFVPSGLNNFFMPVGNNIKSYSMMIYNRWGEKLFKSEGNHVKWDGTYMDEICPEGIYLYSIDYIGFNNTNHSVKGIVELIR